MFSCGRVQRIKVQHNQRSTAVTKYAMHALAHTSSRNRSRETVAKMAPMEPTPSPTNALYSQTSLDVMMLISFTSSIFLRSLIGAICLKRLVFYHQRGLMRWGEIKTVFHVAMFATLFFSLPYFIWCDYYYEDSFCYVNKYKNAEQTLYCLYSLGLVLQVFCLSLTVLNWADFLHGGKYIGEVFYFSRRRSGWLRIALFVINVTVLIIGLTVSVIIIFDPDKAAGNGRNSNGTLIYIEWLSLAIAQIIMVGFLINYGCRLLARIRAAVVFDNRNRRAMIFRLNGVLTTMVFVLVIGIVARLILAMPLYLNNWDSIHPKPAVYMLLGQNPVLWQLVAYILPCDVLSLAMVYLMRTPPRRRASRKIGSLSVKDSSNRGYTKTFIGDSGQHEHEESSSDESETGVDYEAQTSNTPYTVMDDTQ